MAILNHKQHSAFHPDGIRLIGWVIVGALVLVLSPFVVGMILIGAVVFAPDMEGY